MGFIPVNLAAALQKEARIEQGFAMAEQIATKDRITTDLEQAFNPAAANRQQRRLTDFKSLEQRRRPPEAGKKIQEVQEKAEDDLAQNYNKRNPELPPDRLRNARRNLHANQSAEDILGDVSEAFGDPTLTDEALEYLEQTTQGEMRTKVAQARDLLLRLQRREVIAGKNIDEAAKSFYKQGLGSSPTALRDLYRDITGNPREHNTLFSELAEQYPFDELQMVTAFLLKGMAYDLKSKGPSIPEALLMRLMTDTRNLQSILWVYLFFKSRMGLIKSLYERYGLAFKSAMTFEKLAKSFMKLVDERYPTVPKLIKMTDDLDPDELAKVILISQYRDAIRNLSPRVYRSLKHRQDLLTIIVETLEELEEEEEEENDSL